jgi:hypothetical protein
MQLEVRLVAESKKLLLCLVKCLLVSTDLFFSVFEYVGQGTDLLLIMITQLGDLTELIFAFLRQDLLLELGLLAL